MTNPEDVQLIESFERWFNSRSSTERQGYSLSRDDADDPIADWCNDTATATINDYDRLTELYSLGLFGYGADGAFIHPDTYNYT